MDEHCSSLKDNVRSFWNSKSCGEIYGSGHSELEYYVSQSTERYKLEPYIKQFAKFFEGANKRVLEIGVGMGADHAEWAKAVPSYLAGIDLTQRAVEHTRRRLSVLGLSSDVRVADAEALPFFDNSFDVVYSWGVLHHTPDTAKAISEAFRVLRPGGIARIMIYHKQSLTGYMLWTRYALLTGHPWYSLPEIYARHLESPGTKAFTVKEAILMFSEFSSVDLRVQLTFGDLLEGSAGQRHRGILLSIAKRIWPRRVMKLLFKNHGLALMIQARKTRNHT